MGMDDWLCMAPCEIKRKSKFSKGKQIDASAGWDILYLLSPVRRRGMLCKKSVRLLRIEALGLAQSGSAYPPVKLSARDITEFT
jgi:hypothetical protein